MLQVQKPVIPLKKRLLQLKEMKFQLWKLKRWRMMNPFGRRA